MNRRNFLKFFGKASVVTGVVAVTGLPKVDEVLTSEEGPGISDNDYSPFTTTKENGYNGLYYDKDGNLYVGGSFLVSPIDTEPKIVKWNANSWGQLF